MQFRITYSELEHLVSEKSGQQIGFSYGGEHTLAITYGAKVLIKTMNMGLNLTVERVLGTDVRLSYSGTMGVDLMVRTALNQIKSRP